MNDKESKEKCSSLKGCQATKIADLATDAVKKKYLMWDNKLNNCWINAVLAVLAHNYTLKKIAAISPMSRVVHMMSIFDDATFLLNSSDLPIHQKLKQAREKLNIVRESALQFLQATMNYRHGQPESAFCALSCFIKNDGFIRSIFNIKWISDVKCSKCTAVSRVAKNTSILTLFKVESFDPSNPTTLCRCLCERAGLVAKMKVFYTSLPPCLIFHFENGAGDGDKLPLNCIIHGRKYLLTGVVTLKKSLNSSVNHFITWIRDPFSNKWLDCNDLNLDVVSFSPDVPDIKLKDVYMCVFEADDQLTNVEIKPELKIEKIEPKVVPVCDLESDSETTNSENIVYKCNENVKKLEKIVSESLLQNHTSTALDRDISKDVVFANSENKVYACNENVKKLEKIVSESLLQNHTSVTLDSGISENVIPTNNSMASIALNSGISEDVISANNSMALTPLTNLTDKALGEKNHTETLSKQNESLNANDEKDPSENTEAGGMTESKEKIPQKKNLQELEENLLLDSNPKQQIQTKHSLSNVTSASAETSYFKLSLRKKKNSGQKIAKTLVKDSSDFENFYSRVIDAASSKSVTDIKRLTPKVVENSESVTNEMPLKRQRKSKNKMMAYENDTNTRKRACNLKAKENVSGVYNNEMGHSVLNSCYKEKDDGDEEEYQRLLLACSSPLSYSSDEGNPDDCENKWATHKRGCKCKELTLSQKIDTIVDFTFAYICNLGKSLKKS